MPRPYDWEIDGLGEARLWGLPVVENDDLRPGEHLLIGATTRCCSENDTLPRFDPDDSPFERPEIMTGYPMDPKEKAAVEAFIRERDLLG